MPASPTHARRPGRAFTRAAVMSLLGAALAAPAPLAAQGEALRLTLEDALRRAATTSEQVGIARAGVERARGQQAQARAALLPQLGTTLSWQRQLQNQFAEVARRSGSGNSGGGGSDSSSFADNPIAVIFASPYNMVFGLTAQQALFTGGRTMALVRAAGLGRDAAAIGVTSASAQAQLDVTQAYYDAVLADRLLQIAESSLVQTERTLRQVQLSRDVGSASEFDLIRARVTRDNQRPQYLQARTQRDLAHLRLRQLVDLPADQPLALVDGIDETALGGAAPVAAPPTPATVAVPAAEVLAPDPRLRERLAGTLAAADTAAARRAPVRQAVAAVDVAKQQLKAAKAARLPSLGVSTNYQRFAYPRNGFTANLDDFFPNWTVGAQVSFPFFSGGRVRGEIRAAEAAVAEAEQRLQQVREGAELDTRQAVLQLEEAEAAWLASLGTAEQAARAYDIAEVRFREGLSTQLELSESRVQLQQAQANRARAARDAQVARVRLRLLRDLPLAGAAGAPAGAGAAATAAGGQGTAGGGAGAAGATGSFTQPGISR